MKRTNTIRTITEVGMFAALGFVFDELQGILSKGIFVNGGSIGIAMIAVLIIGYRRGFLPALLTGLLMGLMDIATSAYILNPFQLLLDYIFPYAFVALGVLFKPMFDRADSKSGKIRWLVVGAIVGGLAKFLSHYFAGIFFWADPANFAWDLNAMNPYLYCAIYNIAFIGPSIIFTALALAITYASAPRIFACKDAAKTSEGNLNIVQLVLSSVVILGGAFLFVFYLSKYIKSFSDYHDNGAYGYDFDPDSMVIFILGLFTLVLGVISLIKVFKKKFNYETFFGSLSLITLSSWIYCVARILRMIYKKKDMIKWSNTYIPWFIASLVALGIFVALFNDAREAKIEEK